MKTIISVFACGFLFIACKERTFSEGSSTVSRARSSTSSTNPKQTPSNIAIQIPEGRFVAVDPALLRPVNESEFNKNVMPLVRDLKFWSYERQAWIPMPYEDISNNCFARRTAVDAFLWFGQPLKAVQEETTEPDVGNPFNPNATITKYRYLLPGFKVEDFAKNSWIETARISVLGMLKSGETEWSNHEAVVVATEGGTRVVDPSFSKQKLLTLEEWFTYFAPNGKCEQFKSVEDLDRVLQAQIEYSNFHKPWPSDVAKCGYSIHQRLAAEDLVTNTGWSFGSETEKFLSAKFRTYFEDALLAR